MSAAVVTGILSLIGTVIKKAVPNKDEAAKLNSAISEAVLSLSSEELKGSVSVILAEANGDSWLQKNWRPLSMMFFVTLVGAHWLGFTAANLSEDVVLMLLKIVQSGFTGYIVGRSGEKMMKLFKQ